MRETNRLIELYQNLLFKLEKYGDLPTDEAKIKLSLGEFIRARSDLLTQQHLQAADIVREQRIGEQDNKLAETGDNVQRTQGNESTPTAEGTTHPHHE